MTGKNANIYFPETTYDRLRQIAGAKISRFVSEAVEEKIAKEEWNKKEQLRQQLIRDYQTQLKNKNSQKESLSWEKSQFTDLGDE